MFFLLLFPYLFIIYFLAMRHKISVPQPGIEPTSPASEGRFLTTGPLRKSSSLFLKSENTKTPFWECVQARVCFSWWYLCHLWFGAKEFNFDPVPCGCESWFSGGFSQLPMQSPPWQGPYSFSLLYLSRACHHLTCFVQAFHFSFPPIFCHLLHSPPHIPTSQPLGQKPQGAVIWATCSPPTPWHLEQCQQFERGVSVGHVLKSEWIWRNFWNQKEDMGRYNLDQENLKHPGQEGKDEKAWRKIAFK